MVFLVMVHLLLPRHLGQIREVPLQSRDHVIPPLELETLLLYSVLELLDYRGWVL